MTTRPQDLGNVLESWSHRPEPAIPGVFCEFLGELREGNKVTVHHTRQESNGARLGQLTKTTNAQDVIVA
ncbi:hypothetical protein E2C01_062914 [Portunus trituberculatus]|uniref:Uncharacterized protein n=1 Tax=Portunus trituberculatus TaxID=210409 RepID=A0A5B7H965_PORTR|nr:hypothetical protein [Portunus trituberculatus]